MVLQLQRSRHVPQGVTTVFGPRGYSEERDAMQYVGMCQSRPGLHWRLRWMIESSGMDRLTRCHLKWHRSNHGLTRPDERFGLVAPVRVGVACGAAAGGLREGKGYRRSRWTVAWRLAESAVNLLRVAENSSTTVMASQDMRARPRRPRRCTPR